MESRRKFIQLSVLGLGGLIISCRKDNHVPDPIIPTGNVPDPNTGTLAFAIATAAKKLYDSLEANKIAKGVFAFNNADRTRWHWTTPAGFPRNGLPLSDMNNNQKVLAMELLKESISAKGYATALSIIGQQSENGSNPDLYYVSLFGRPFTKSVWGWRFEGHHLSHQFTIVGEQISVTPFFHGTLPVSTYTGGGRYMATEEDAAREIITSLSPSMQSQAIFQTNAPGDHFTLNQPKVNPLPHSGLLVKDMSGTQVNLINQILEQYLGSQTKDFYDTTWAKIRSTGIENIRFAWAGGILRNQNHYYRLQSSDFLMEFDNSRNNGNHIHSVWRDFNNDFGYAIL